MARTRRNEVSRARRGASARGERRVIRSPVNDPAAASNAWIQQHGTHLGAPSDMIMGSSLQPSVGVDVQPEVHTGYLPGGMDVHQPSGTNSDVLTLAELHTTQCLENTDIGAANLQSAFPLESGNQSSESIHASLFQSYGSLANILPCNYPTSNLLHAAATPSIASDYDFPSSLCVGPEVISPLPEVLPLQEAENSHMLDQLFPPEQGHNAFNSLPPQQQLYQRNHLEGPMQMVSYGPPSYSHTSLAQLPLSEMIHHSATYPQSFSFGDWHQQGPQQPLPDLAGDMQRQLLGSAPFHSSSSSKPYAMEYDPAEYPPFPDFNVIPAIVPNIVGAAPTANITPFNSPAQSPATFSASPDCALVPNGSAPTVNITSFNSPAQSPATVSALPNSSLRPDGSAHSASASHTNVAERKVTAGRGRVPRKRQSRQATIGRPRQVRPAPTPVASSSIMNLTEVELGRIESKRQKHIMSERRKRMQMNEFYATIRSLLPPPATARKDNATVVQDMINYVNRLKHELRMLEQQLKHSQQLVEVLCNVIPSIHGTDTAAAWLLTTEGFTCVDQTHDPSALTTVTALPAVDNYSGLGSFLGTNVVISYFHDHYTLTITSPYLGQAVALLEPMLVAIQNHRLEVLFASIMTTGNTHVYTLQCEASSDAEVLRNNLHRVLQGILNNFPSSS